MQLFYVDATTFQEQVVCLATLNVQQNTSQWKTVHV